jgi:hypothetical protein
MAISRVGATNGTTSADATTVAVTRTVTAGNGGILFIAAHGAATVTVGTVSDGTNTWVQATGIAGSPATGVSGDLWYCKSFAGSGSITVTVTWAASASASGSLTLIEVTGQDTATFYDTGKSTAATTASCASGATANLTASNEFVTGAFCGNGNNTFSAAAFSPNGTITAETVANSTTSGHKNQVAAFDMVGGTGGSTESFTVTDSTSSAGLTVCAAWLAGGGSNTATASLTVTPSFSLVKAEAHVQAMTVTPAFAVKKAEAHVQALTVTPVFSAVPSHSGTGLGGAYPDRHHRRSWNPR